MEERNQAQTSREDLTNMEPKQKKTKTTAEGQISQDNTLTMQTETDLLQCAICLKFITTETIGKPDKCEHKFCLVCLLEWSNRVKKCPVDRIPYEKIFFTNQSHGKLEGFVVTADDSLVLPPDDDDSIIYICAACGEGDLENDQVGLCCACGLGFHWACSTPEPRGEIPEADDEENWFCLDCMQRMTNVEVRVTDIYGPRGSV